MNERARRTDPEAVFDRDDYACKRCGESCGTGETADARGYPVGSVPDGAAHERILATVCEPCFERLSGADETTAPAVSASPGAVFELLREITTIQGGAVSAVAEFASDGTALTGETDADPTDYLDARRELRVTLEWIDRRLEAAAAVDCADLGDDASEAYEEFHGLSTRLQAELLTVVELVETALTGVYRCHGCFGRIDGTLDRCDECGTAHPETADWSDDGTVQFDALFSTINETLQGAGETTDGLTDRTTVLAETLLAR